MSSVKVSEAVMAQRRVVGVERLVDYFEMTKPRIAALVLVTVAVGATVAAHGTPDPRIVLHAMLGTALVAGGASVLNQVIERDSDRLMRRTANRPLPAGRVSVGAATRVGALLAVVGTIYLLLTTNPTTAALAALSLLLYVWVYTPLKRHTTLNTAVGAVSGALPPVIGWSAVSPDLGVGAWSLFLIVFLWQFPHFLAIAWIYRDDYERAGLRMLPTSARGRGITGLQAVSYASVLLPICLAPSVLGFAGPLYFWGALVLGLQFWAYSLAFALRASDDRARKLLWASLVHLPGVLGLLLLDLNRYVA